MALVSISDYEKKAEILLTKMSWDYYRGGAGDELTLRSNRAAYDRLRIRPRVLVDVAQRNTKCNILGIDLDFPVAIAPTAMHKLASSEGEVASAKAAGNFNTIYTLSISSNTSIEEVATAAPNTNKWFQLHIYKDRELTERLVRRAENAGYNALVLLVDCAVFGVKRSCIKNNFNLPKHLQLAIFQDEKSFMDNCTGGSSFSDYVGKLYDETLDWDAVQWLTARTKLPVILKGILTHEDATLALNSGCKGIIVSNHGGRQLDSVPATLEALPEIVLAVGDKLLVMVDGGIRNGIDIFKALALGAKAVFIGRPILYGLAVNGQNGVESVLNILKKELETTMALAGVCNLSQINRNYVVDKSTYRISKL